MNSKTRDIVMLVCSIIILVVSVLNWLGIKP